VAFDLWVSQLSTATQSVTQWHLNILLKSIKEDNEYVTKAFFMALLFLTGVGSAEEWPNRPILLVVSYPPGGTADLMARTIAGPLGKALGTSVGVEQTTRCKWSNCSCICS
jgi:hypothetical protein